MSTPSAFDIGRATGTNFGESFRRSRDEGAIENILSNAMQSGDPAVLQQSIGQILSQVSPERQGPAIQYLQNSMQNIQQRQQQDAQRQAALQAGIDPNLPQALQVEQFKAKAKAQRILGSGINEPNQPAQTIQPPPQPVVPGQAPSSVTPSAPSPVKTGLQAMSDDQIVRLTGHPDREVSEPAKAEQKRREVETAEIKKDERQARKEIIEFHKETQKYDEDLIKQNKTAKSQIETIESIEKAVSSGNVKPSSLANILKRMGPKGEAMAEAILNKDEATLLASIPSLLEGWKEVFGVRLTDADLKLLQDKLPSIGKTPEANKAITKVLRKYADMTLLRAKIASQIKEENKGLRPLGYADKIEKRFDEMVKPVKIINPNNGKVIEIPAYKLSDAMEGGATLVNE